MNPILFENDHGAFYRNDAIDFMRVAIEELEKAEAAKKGCTKCTFIDARAMLAHIEEHGLPASSLISPDPVLHPREVSRSGDMGGGAELQLLQQDDGDWIVSVKGPGFVSDRIELVGVEFCTPMMGGGKSPRTWEALRALAIAMAADAADPQVFGGRAEHLG